MFETAAAISTPYGKGGVALIRVSGDNAVEICSRVFFPASGKGLCDAPARTALFGSIKKQNDIIDTGIATLFRAPVSFTGEDVVEITCHGGILVSSSVLEAVFEAGATPAGPGEFTKRAFINGKLTLSAAEAVADIIDAHSYEMLRLSSANVRGALGRELTEIYDELERVVASCYVENDFPGEELSGMSDADICAALRAVDERVAGLVKSYRTGRAISEGIATVIVGKPNTGKSSLLNMMCGQQRAIVTDIAGTTRDIIEEKVCCGRVTLRLCDTAGIRATRNRVESIGVERAKDAMKEADLVLAVFDSSSPLDRYDAHLLGQLRELNCAKIAIINKSDLGSRMDEYQLGGIFDGIVHISAALGEGKDELFEMIENMYVDGAIDYDSTAIVANARQHAALSNTHARLSTAINAIESGMSADIAALEAESALSELAATDGRSVGDGIVNQIFSRFCVGK